eukprot:GILK01006931.1.p1 GENE.GILK01006931.1~~GILK01006931.1.p1  ORF type:complete len:156 (+),score=16.81 GILK01006931.1:41-508(+)
MSEPLFVDGLQLIVCGKDEVPPGMPHINCAQEVICKHGVGETDCLRLEWTDTYGQSIEEGVEDTIKFIQRIASSSAHSCVAIHCHQGMSRAPTAAMAVLMTLSRWPLSQCHEALIAYRPRVKPNWSFMSHLVRMEERLFGQVSFQIPDKILKRRK